MRAASSTRGPDWLWLGGVVGAEFRGRVHEGSFGVLGPAFKRVFLVGVSGDGNEFGVGRQRSALPGSAGKGACCEWVCGHHAIRQTLEERTPSLMLPPNKGFATSEWQPLRVRLNAHSSLP